MSSHVLRCQEGSTRCCPQERHSRVDIPSVLLWIENVVSLGASSEIPKEERDAIVQSLK